jgi:hypothetical protein
VPTRDEALNRLRGDAAELRSVRSEEIVAEAISRATGVTHVNLFSGDFTVSGDFAAGPGVRRGPGTRTAKVRLAPDTLAKESACYARPADFELGVDTLDRTHLVVYAGPARTGRDARARVTMVEVLRRNNLAPAFFELNQAVLGNIAWQPPHRQCAYLIRDLPNAQGKHAAESLAEAWLTHASERARAHDSYLVVVTGPIRGTLATASNQSEFVLTDLDLPDPREIVRARVTHEVGWLTESEVDDRLAATELADILEERDDPRFATRTANAITEALRTKADLSAVVSKLRDPEEQVREWLGADPDTTDVALVLATAGLEGCGYLSVSDAAVSLHRKLGGSSTTMTPRYLRGLLAERSWIRIVESDDGTRVVRFRHTELRPAVLALTWFELDGARQTILDWLAELAHHADVEVRARAASTAGLLAARDLEHGLHRFFLPWARNNSAILRQSAATGLNVAGSVSGKPEIFWKHVERWAEQVRYDEDKRALPATAALAAGGTLGVADPARALRVLHTLVHEGGWDLLEPVAVSTHLLLAAGRAGSVIDELLEWTDSAVVTEPVIKALTMFAFAAIEKGADDGPVLLPSVRELRDTLPEIWGRALDCEPVRPMAVEALRVWVMAADTDPSARPAVLDILAGIADRGDQDYARLCHLLEQWAEDPDAPSESAARFYTELAEEGGLIR